ncbi:glutamate 5-kinase [Iodobacter sp. HSC-16F04]|uniref:Glutamate 5-kinase n=1 Tax=Iodobacter violaceini TaxID=3044271 RepID=A0ABX0L5K1_9NEIS|nr:glutamate 5-kinase [Iodobacter violacea]NHQ87903.1 glutamate 5-kinase [Iodobacter violacea]
MSQSIIHAAHRIVVKVGSSLVTNEGRGLDHAALLRWAQEIAEVSKMGKQVVLVSSGAIAEGVARLGWSQKPTSVHEKQAAAAVGQMGLCQAYESAFRAYGLKTAQILLTHEDLADRTRYLNARSTLMTLLNLGVIPIINENDTVVTAEIKFGDNDTLGALVTNLIEGDALIILTDQTGLYTADPRSDPDARLVEEAEAGDARLEDMAGGAGSSVGTGGMYTKIIAAKRAARSGASTVIASGREHEVLARLARGERIGTQLTAQSTPIAAKKQWIADHLLLKGSVVLDAGAVRALRLQGSSLLPIGVKEALGDFLRGDVVSCVDAGGVEIARGLANYSAAETRRIMRLPTGQIEAALGYIDESELIHRDNMVLMD